MSFSKALARTVISLAIMPLLGAAHLPTPAHATPSAAHAGLSAMTFNQHLHVAAPTPTAHATTTHAPTAAAHPTTAPGASSGHNLLVNHTTWGAHWDSHAFIALHRGLATIHGEVRSAAGQPAGSVRVALRKPKGHIFANVSLRHVTYTAPDGTFTMTDVRPGSYRVRASENKKKGTAQKQVHANAIEMVNIKL